MFDLQLRPLSGLIAAEAGARLEVILADASAQLALRDALNRYGVLVLPGADPSPTQHIALGVIFGTPEPPAEYNPSHPDHPEVCVFDSEGGYKADKWHADLTWQEEPVTGAVLVMRVRPSVGGDTVWSNVAAAYDALSNGMKQLLGGRRAHHEIAPGFAATHPVIRIHPETDRRLIYVNDVFTRSIINLPPGEADAVLGFLLKHVTRPEFTYRHRWNDGDVVIWDNRSTQHYAFNDFDGHRVVHRVGFIGVPFASADVD